MLIRMMMMMIIIITVVVIIRNLYSAILHFRADSVLKQYTIIN